MNTETIVVNGRSFKLRYSAPSYVLRLPWASQCRVNGEGNDGAARFFAALEGQSVSVCFTIPALGVVHGYAFFQSVPLLVNGDMSLSFEGTGELSQVRRCPDPVESGAQVAHGVTMGMVENAVRDTVASLCPPDVTVTVRGTERVKGIEKHHVIIKMFVGGDPW